MAVRGKIAEQRRTSWALRSVCTRSCSRMRWSSSQVGESLRVMALAMAASRMAAAWSRPSARSTSASDSVVASSLGVVVGVAVEEGIVALHGVGLDDEVVGAGVAGDDGLGWLAEATREA